jgi:hypothetical protein
VKEAVFKTAKEIAKLTREEVTMEPQIGAWLRPEVEDNKNSKTIEGLKQRRGDVMIQAVTVASLPRRTITIIDVRHCSMRTPLKRGEIGASVREGEAVKEAFYDKHFDLPKGVKLVPFAIDSYGKWGEQAKTFLEDMCRKAAAEDLSMYNKLVTKARADISLAHARAVGAVFRKCFKYCFAPEDYVRACVRGYGVDCD